MASGHARLKKALVLRDALAHELGLDLAAVMRGLSTVEDTMTADLAMADGNYLAQMESLCRGDASLLTEADQAVRAACQTVKLAPRYAQYLSLILFAHWQKCRSTDEGAFLERLNAFLADWAQKNRSETISPFTADDLQFAAFWMATGSGKTHVLHACIAMLHAAGTWDRTILITPSESLSRQHADKLRETKAFDVFAYPMDGDASSLGRLHPDTVIVVDINKLAETKKGDGVTIPTSVFRDGRNLVFVDEGHKGQRSEESVWKKLQSDLAGIGDSQPDHRGMLVEFSATFGQVAEAEATFGRYAKAIMLDYAYDRFHADLYGKDFWNVKLDGHDETTEEIQHTTLTAALIAYWYQLASFGKSDVQKQIKDRGLRIAKPLWVLLGLSVIGGKNEGDKEQTSDVIDVLRYLDRALSEDDFISEGITRVLDAARQGASLLPEVVTTGLHAMSAAAIQARILNDVFGWQDGDIPLFRVLKTSPGEMGLGLRRGDSVHYYGVVNVGDVKGLKDALEAASLEVEDDAFTASLFADLELANSGVNLLIGSRRFAEGWDNYRASSLTLLRLGQNEGSLIIQMFGRVVRFAGTNGNGKRLRDIKGDLAALQTAFVFGLKSRYLQAFLAGLFENGIGEKTRTVCDVQNWLPEAPALLSIKAVGPQQSAFLVDLRDVNWLKSVNKVVVSYAAGVATARIGRDGLDENAARVGSDVTAAFKQTAHLLDIDAIYSELVQWKGIGKRWNLRFDRTSVSTALHSGPYEVWALPGFCSIQSRQDIQRLQIAASTVARKLFESAYRKIEAKHSRYEIIGASESGIPSQYFKEITNA
ncbi:DEAD/DEAH box helicase family protein [Paracoccus jiaweipingae]|uniref:DEAD/DEAH box helicase family protein n=1 Tax=unclassified Paracoccus (in: a-proteobacteria) TaxID=2688777 RepID=UPI0037936CF8